MLLRAVSRSKDYPQKKSNYHLLAHFEPTFYPLRCRLYCAIVHELFVLSRRRVATATVARSRRFFCRAPGPTTAPGGHPLRREDGQRGPGQSHGTATHHLQLRRCFSQPRASRPTHDRRSSGKHQLGTTESPLRDRHEMNFTQWQC